MLAVDQGQTETAQLLIDRGADFDHENEEGSTPLILAAYGGDWDMTDLLLNAGADPEKANKNGNVAADFTEDQDILDLLDGYYF